MPSLSREQVWPLQSNSCGQPHSHKQRCIRRGGAGGGRGGLKGKGGGSEGKGGRGGGGGWDPPPPWVPLWSLPRAGRKLLSVNPLGTEGAEANFWPSASNIGRGGGVLEEGSGGGGTPPSSYGVRPFLYIPGHNPHLRALSLAKPKAFSLGF